MKLVESDSPAQPQLRAYYSHPDSKGTGGRHLAPGDKAWWAACAWLIMKQTRGRVESGDTRLMLGTAPHVFLCHASFWAVSRHGHLCLGPGSDVEWVMPYQ